MFDVNLVRISSDFTEAQRGGTGPGVSVSRQSSRLPLCVTLQCVITSRIIGSVGGNTKRGYKGQNYGERKHRKPGTVFNDAACWMIASSNARH